MAKNGPIIIFEDDEDDRSIIVEVLQELGVRNTPKFFDKGAELIQYLLTTREQPFIILSDVNVPGMDGTDIRRIINENDFLRQKSIPFIFFTTTASKTAVREAYLMMVQGYFEKEQRYEQMKETLRVIIDYWKLCRHPNNQ